MSLICNNRNCGGVIRYCPTCGNELRNSVCDRCGMIVKFCQYCGQPLNDTVDVTNNDSDIHVAGFVDGALVFEDRGSAMLVRDKLIDIIVLCGKATLYDFYDISGVSINAKDEYFHKGWSNPVIFSIHTHVIPTKGGFKLKLPRCIYC